MARLARAEPFHPDEVAIVHCDDTLQAATITPNQWLSPLCFSSLARFWGKF
jgi:hypothetical protein